MIIPREGDKVRFYIQLSASDVLDPATGRVNKDRMSPEKLLEVCRLTLRILIIVHQGCQEDIASLQSS